jgi:hypothetical protein
MESLARQQTGIEGREVMSIYTQIRKLLNLEQQMEEKEKRENTSTATIPSPSSTIPGNLASLPHLTKPSQHP